MEIKYTIQGLLIYATMAAYLLAFIATATGRRKKGHALFVGGFYVALASYIYRWVHIGHAPLQNLFDVFLSLGLLCYPISWFCRRVLRIGGQWADMLIGVAVLFPAGFVFDATSPHLPPALQSWLFVPHVSVYMFAYIFMAKAALAALTQLMTSLNKSAGLLLSLGLLTLAGTLGGLFVATAYLLGQPSDDMTLGMVLYIWGHGALWGGLSGMFTGLLGLILGILVDRDRDPDMKDAERATYELVAIGFPLLTLGLLLGSVWGKLAWGDYWGWDPKELWSLASWLVYVGYLHWRYMFGTKYPKINSAWAITGLTVIVITLLWANLSPLFPGLHSYAT